MRKRMGRAAPTSLAPCLLARKKTPTPHASLLPPEAEVPPNFPDTGSHVPQPHLVKHTTTRIWGAPSPLVLQSK